MSIDLRQFHEVFFEESLEGLDAMEQALLSFNTEQPDSEVINTIFRAAHSIKGGSGTFGFQEIADFTHVLETLLDEVRDEKRALTSEAIELLLQSCDCLRSMVEALQGGDVIDNSIAQPLIQTFEAMLAGDSGPVSTPVDEPAPAPTAVPTTSEPSTVAGSNQSIMENTFDVLLNGDSSAGERNTPEVEAVVGQWRIQFQPEPQILMSGNEPLRIFRELAAFGELKVEANIDQVPTFDQLTADECFISWTLWLAADVDEEQILEVFEWVIDECQLEIEQIGQNPEPAQQPAPQAIAEEANAQAIKAVSATTTTPPSVALKPSPVEPTEETTPIKPNTPANAQGGSSSIRVGIDKVDELINLVGELVITQSMLSEMGDSFSIDKVERLQSGLEQLQQNTRELQESVMRIRMLPISFAFNRFPRMIRDLATKTGKHIELKLSGEQTELDKTVMEQISDPLVHLVRNAADHGLEGPEERQAQGKETTGTVHLNAYHKGGNIVIEISDDGRGMDPQTILAKAIEKGVVDNNVSLEKQQIFELIFEPGFSTAEVVSDISGRGVGMDVVRRNIQSLGGRIEVESEPGKGSTFRVHLPLTLAILDGQLVRVGDQVYIIPLVAIVESLQIKPELVNHVAGNMVLYRLREDNVPIIPIHEEFDIPADNTEIENGLLVVAEGDGQKIGLLVDDLLAQQQVVIKSLESNYKRIEGISGASILGDGSVSMILDIPGMIRRASDQRTAKTANSRVA